MKKHSKMNSSHILWNSIVATNRSYDYAYQNLRNDLSQTVTHIARTKKDIPEGMKLSEHINHNTLQELDQCINAAQNSGLITALSESQSINHRIAYAFVTRFILDISHFRDEYVSDGNLHHDYVTPVSGDVHHHES